MHWHTNYNGEVVQHAQRKDGEAKLHLTTHDFITPSPKTSVKAYVTSLAVWAKQGCQN
jgi:hypothetical protein